MISDRYAKWNGTEIGKSILSDQEDLESLTRYAYAHGDGVKLKSSHIEHVKSRLNDYLV
ncbi:hypothetical protein [Listeria aquatica]|uniref:hypothetical protein n=1 Tax=Listeria aquatica TaxID=1494960 RepID=UPI0031F47E70